MICESFTSKSSKLCAGSNSLTTAHAMSVICSIVMISLLYCGGCRQQFLNAPNVVSQASGHRRSLFVDAAMLAAKVVVSEEQRQRRFQVLPLLRESVG